MASSTTSSAPPSDGGAAAAGDVETLVRLRLRGLRTALGYSLDDLAARTNLSASTISRIETGKRTISLDMLRPLCEALHTDLATLLDTTTADEDVVIRPVASHAHGQTVWPLTRNRGDGGLTALKMRIEPLDRPRTGELGVHPGHDWFFVLSGTVVLTLGERDIEVHQGEAAEFSTMTPHAFAAKGGPAEVIMIFDHDGHRVHVAEPSDQP